MRRPLGLIVPLLGTCAVIPVGLLIMIGEREVMPPMWVHFYGGGFALMAALLAVRTEVAPAIRKAIPKAIPSQEGAA